MTKQPQPMRFQQRDGEILLTLYNYDGVLARRHVHAMFWPEKKKQAMERRLKLLYEQDYIDWPNAEQRRTKPGPQSIVWLGWNGILYVAGRSGLDVEPPSKINENQLRSLQQRLRKHGVRWQREPRWSRLQHDLAVVDFRMAVEKAVAKIHSLTLEQWLPEGVFLSDPDQVEYRVTGRDGKQKREKKGVIPDGFFVIVDEKGRSRCLLEMDMRTHALGQFGREKAAPYAAYIRSPAYKARFGYASGRCLVITTGDVRMKNLMEQTLMAAGAGAKAFWFTTFKRLETENVLTDPVWLRADWSEPGPLFSLQ